jgi:hypothetical protein
MPGEQKATKPKMIICAKGVLRRENIGFADNIAFDSSKLWGGFYMFDAMQVGWKIFIEITDTPAQEHSTVSSRSTTGNPADSKLQTMLMQCGQSAFEMFLEN